MTKSWLLPKPPLPSSASPIPSHLPSPSRAPHWPNSQRLPCLGWHKSLAGPVLPRLMQMCLIQAVPPVLTQTFLTQAACIGQRVQLDRTLSYLWKCEIFKNYMDGIPDDLYQEESFSAMCAHFSPMKWHGLHNRVLHIL